jgi:lysophospholipase L1-like esterase
MERQLGIVKYRVKAVLVLAGAALLAPGCWPFDGAGSPMPSTTAGSAIRYVALGDSYTIGTGVSTDARWPNQLVSALEGRVALELVANLGANGYSSADLLRDELPQLADLQPGFVTILIGVNDVVRGVSIDTYRTNVQQILGAVLEEVPRERIVVVATPDYTRTPRGADYGDPSHQRAEIAAFNAAMRDMAEARGIAFVDISPIADQVAADPSLVAGDQLHPSGEQYRRWVELIGPVVEDLLSD